MNNQINQTNLVKCPVCQSLISPQAVNCPKCGQPLQNINYQSFQAQPMPLTQAPKSGGGQMMRIGCLGLILLAAISGLISFVSLPRNSSTQNESKLLNNQVNSSSSSSKQSDSIDSTEVPPSALAAVNFKSKVMKIPAGKKVISKVELARVPNTLNLYMTEYWETFSQSQKRTLTTQLYTLWKQELGTSNAILHIYNIAGEEVAGGSIMSGAWVQDE